MNEVLSPTSRPRVLSGMRPTGRLHLGNYVGALRNWVELQDLRDAAGEPVYDCFFFIADWHALTTDYADPSQLKQNVFEVALDFLACGLDPEQSTIFIQSHVPQHAELNLLLSMITPLSWLERVPTYKDQQEQLREKDLATYGFLGYPLLQSADILLYRPQFVPVGADQVAHVEITREIARRFNYLYVPKRIRASLVATHGMLTYPDNEPDPESPAYLPEPEVLLTPSPKLPGTDGRKMSKSYGNTIQLTDQPSLVQTKIKEMTNGGQRFHQRDPGDPEICPVGDLHRVFSSREIAHRIRVGCRTAGIGCIDCKFFLSESINRILAPIRDRRFELEDDPSQVFAVLDRGAEKARRQAELTMEAVRSEIGLNRDDSGIRFEHTIKRVANLVAPLVHNLSSQSEWWNLSPSALREHIESYWLSNALPVDSSLQMQNDGSLLTQRKKRVLVLSAKEDEGQYAFSAPAKSYEVIVLLCWRSDYMLVDFVVPQAVYVASWSTAKKRDKKGEIHLRVAWLDNRFYLLIEDFPGIDITKFQSAYATLD